MFNSAIRLLERHQRTVDGISTTIKRNLVQELVSTSMSAAKFEDEITDTAKHRLAVQLELSLNEMSEAELDTFRDAAADIMNRMSGNWVITSMATLVRLVIRDHVMDRSLSLSVIREYGHLCPEYGALNSIVAVMSGVRSGLPHQEIAKSAKSHMKAAYSYEGDGDPYVYNRKLVQFVDEHYEHVDVIIAHWNLMRTIPESIEQAIEMAELGAVRDGWL